MLKETHLRTIVKTVVYRIGVMLAIFSIALAFGGTVSQAMGFGIITLVLGSAIYYGYDRLWLLTGWKVNNGYESRLRSIVKAIIYRFIILGVVMLMAKFILTASNSTALSLALIQSAANIIIYYIVERGFNIIKWGKLN